MKNLFQKAEKIQRHVKVEIIGDAGVGKTCTALLMPRPLALIDLEGGSVHYGDHPVFGGFDRLSTKRIADIKQAIEYCQRGEYATLVIDPVTVIWQLLQDAALANLRRKKSNISETEISLSPREWGIIKGMYSSLMTTIVNLPCHVVLCARQKDIVTMDKQGNPISVIHKADAEKSTAYYLDVIVRLEMRGKKRVAIVEKDRTGNFQVGDVVDDFDIKCLIKDSVGKREVLQSEEEAAIANADLFDRSSHLDDDIPTYPDEEPAPAQPEKWVPKPNWGKIHAAAKEAGLTHEDLHTLCGVESLKDLPDATLAELPKGIVEWGKELRMCGGVMNDIREDLESASTLQDLDEYSEKWREEFKSLPKPAKKIISRIKTKAEEQLKKIKDPSSDLAD